MRLLNTETLKFQAFFDSARPPYLILSHRWSADETTLQQFEAERYAADSPDPSCKGVTKVRQFCQQARKAKYDWVWVDTCCIDKTSSAELTESINSMWRWYREADRCYVYLDDVATAPPSWKERSVNEETSPATPSNELSPEAVAVTAKELAGSDWFKRGFTLQELLAPAHVLFFDPQWNFVCERDEPGIREVISDITHIHSRYFGNPRLIKEALVAERMSWICGRQTSRVEDIAYCLLGLFDIHMPLIYGEGWNAFLRLQLEIIAKYDDESIFAWERQGSDIEEYSGLLAARPSCFAWISQQEAHVERKQCINRAPYRMTNKGIEFEIFDSKHARKLDVSWKIPLNCWVPDKGWVCLELAALRDGSFYRSNPNSLIVTEDIFLGSEHFREFRKRLVIHVRQFDIPQST